MGNGFVGVCRYFLVGCVYLLCMAKKIDGEVVQPVEGRDGATVLRNDTYESVTVDISDYDGEVGVDDSVVIEEDGSADYDGFRLVEVK